MTLSLQLNKGEITALGNHWPVRGGHEPLISDSDENVFLTELSERAYNIKCESVEEGMTLA